MLGLQGEAHDTNHCQIIKARLAAQGLARQSSATVAAQSLICTARLGAALQN
jgi:hypothetical protein